MITFKESPEPTQEQKPAAVERNPALLRTALVLQWIQFAVILVALGIALLFLSGFILIGDAEMALFGLAFLVGGPAIALVMAAIAFIASGDFRMLPPNKARAQRMAFVAVPLVTLMAAVLIDQSNERKQAAEQVAEATQKPWERDWSKPQPEPESEWEITSVTDVNYQRYGSFKHSVTGRVVIQRKFRGADEPEYIQATVVDGWLIARAKWSQPCKPGTSIAEGVTCNENGDAFVANFRMQNPDWDSYSSLRWEMDVSGYKVSERFLSWPLEKSRQADAAIKAAGGPMPDPKSATVRDAARFEG